MGQRALNIFTDKKADVGEQITFAYFFFMMVVISGAIVVGVLIVFGSGYDFRESDAYALNYQIEKCLIANNGQIKWDNFYGICRLEKSVVENGDYYVGIIEDGNIAFKFKDYKVCELTGEKSDAYPKCAIKEFSAGGKSFRIITGSSQTARGIL